jgi:hypothetical protein
MAVGDVGSVLDQGRTSIYLLVPRDFLIPRTDGEPPEILGVFGDMGAATERNRELGACHVVARLRMTNQPGALSARDALRRQVDRQRHAAPAFSIPVADVDADQSARTAESGRVNVTAFGA